MPNSDKIFASIDYNGVVNVWDIRTSVAVGSIEAHDGKGLALEWHVQPEDENSVTVISGGSDCCLKSTKLNVA